MTEQQQQQQQQSSSRLDHSLTSMDWLYRFSTNKQPQQQQQHLQSDFLAALHSPQQPTHSSSSSSSSMTVFSPMPQSPLLLSTIPSIGNDLAIVNNTSTISPFLSNAVVDIDDDVVQLDVIAAPTARSVASSNAMFQTTDSTSANTTNTTSAVLVMPTPSVAMNSHFNQFGVGDHLSRPVQSQKQSTQVVSTPMLVAPLPQQQQQQQQQHQQHQQQTLHSAPTQLPPVATTTTVAAAPAAAVVVQSSQSSAQRAEPHRPIDLTAEYKGGDHGKRDGKPPYSYVNLITFAINSTPRRRMTLNEIYQWIVDNFKYYKNAGNGWKVSPITKQQQQQQQQ